MTTTITRSALAPTVLRTNQCTNPRPATSLAGYQGAASALASGVMSDGTPCAKVKTTTAVVPWLYTAKAQAAVNAGETWVLSAMIEIVGDTAGTLYNVNAHASTGNVFFASGAKTVAAGAAPQRVTIICTPNAAVAAGEFDLSVVRPSAASGPEIRVGDVLIEKASSFLGFFYGDTPPAGGKSYAWTGLRDASPSIQTTPNPAVVYTPQLMTAYDVTRISQNGIIAVPGRPDPIVIARGASLRSGSMTFLLGDEAAAEAFDAIMDDASTFVLVDTDRQIVGMTFVLGTGGYKVSLDDDSRDLFTAQVDFVEVAA